MAAASRPIQPIDKGAVHRICSGQVVLDLTTAVKELVENSLDAGATSIEVRLREYGAEMIEVADNGCGVAPENYQGLTLKYHTSKISQFSDLQSLTSFGFRGEALSSLCALADVSILTRTKDQEAGTRLHYDHTGRIVSQESAARPVGTSVYLGRLFNPLPVRHKEFTRNIRREYGRMLGILQAYALIAKNVRLVCTNQSSRSSRATVLHTQGSASIKENIITVFGSKTVACLDPLNISLSDELFVEGFVSKHGSGSGRGSGDRQYFYVNGRPVEMPKVSKLLNELYRSFNSQQYPMAVLNFQLPTTAYDVNVTPDKRKVFLHAENELMAGLREALGKLYAPNKYTFSVNKVEAGVTPSEKSCYSAVEDLVDYETQCEVVDGVVEDDLNAKTLDSVVELGEETDQAEEDVPERPHRPAANNLLDLLSFRCNGTTTKNSTKAANNSGMGADSSVRKSIQVKVSSFLSHSKRSIEGDGALSGQPVLKKKASSAECRTSPLSPKRSNVPDVVEDDLNAKTLDSEVDLGEETDQAEEDLPDRPHRPAANVLVDLLSLGNGTTTKTSTKAASNSGVETAASLKKSIQMKHSGFVSHSKRNIEDDGPLSEQPVLKRNASSVKCRTPPLSPKRRNDVRNGPSISPTGYISPSSRINEGLLSEEPLLKKCWGLKNVAVVDAVHSTENMGAKDTSLTVAVRPGTEATGSCPEDFCEVPCRSSAENYEEGGLSSKLSPMLGDNCLLPSSEQILEHFRDVHPEVNVCNLGERDFSAASNHQADEKGFTNVCFDMKKLRNRIGRGLIRYGKSQVTETHGRKSKRRFFTAATVELEGLTKGEKEKEAALAAATRELDRSFNKADFKRMKVLGQFNLGFILARLDQDIFIIDQHASDEKHNFERLSKTTVLNRQPLLKPMPLNLSAAEEVTISTHMETFRHNGFDFIEQEDAPPGQRLRLSAVPFSKNVTFGVPDVQELVSLLLDEAPCYSTGSSLAQFLRPSRVRAMLASRACRSSIMIGDALSKKEMEKVVTHLADLDAPWNCPHGRPTMRHLVDLSAICQGASDAVHAGL